MQVSTKPGEEDNRDRIQHRHIGINIMLCLFPSQVQAQWRPFDFPAQMQHKLELSHLLQTGDPTSQHQPPAASHRSLGHCPWDRPRRTSPCRTRLKTCQSQRDDSGPTTTKGNNKTSRIPQCGYWASLLYNTATSGVQSTTTSCQTADYKSGWKRPNPPKTSGEIKLTAPTGLQVNTSTPPSKSNTFFHTSFKGPGLLFSLESNTMPMSLCKTAAVWV